MKAQAIEAVASRPILGHYCSDQPQGPGGVVAQEFQFGDFTLDQSRYRLQKGDRLLRLEKLPMELLILLAQRRGELVSREEIAERLWGNDVFLDVDHGINTAIRKVRRALRDDPDKPRFVETVVGKGYRFAAPVICKESDFCVEEPPPQPLADASSETVTATAKAESGWRLRRLLLGGVAVVVLLAIALLLSYRRRGGPTTQPAIKSLAVLPLKNLSGDPGQEYLADGMTEELIAQLANIHDLRVISRTSVMRFKDTRESVPDIARALNVDAVLEGSVVREGNLVRVHAQLIRGATDEHIWAQEYEREYRGLLDLQEEVAQTIARQVGASATPSLTPAHSINPDAYQAYLQAQYFFHRGAEKVDLDKAFAYADHAVKLDSNYSSAWALRSVVLSDMAGEGFIDTDDGSRRAREDAERAIALDPNSAAGYLALATIHIGYDLDWEGARASLDKAGTLQPGSADLLGNRSTVEEMLGRLHEAIELQKEAIALDPLQPGSYVLLGNLLYEAGSYEEASTAFHKALELNPEHAFAHEGLGKVILAQGHPNEALVEIHQEPLEGQKLVGEALVYHALGREQDSTAALTALIASHSKDQPYQIAEVYAYRGETDKALEWLGRAYENRDSGLIDVKIDPLLTPLRQNPRYIEVLKKMRLPL